MTRRTILTLKNSCSLGCRCATELELMKPKPIMSNEVSKEEATGIITETLNAVKL